MTSKKQMVAEMKALEKALAIAESNESKALIEALKKELLNYESWLDDLEEE